MKKIAYIKLSRIYISICVSFLVLGSIYWRIDLANVFDILLHIDWFLFAGSFIMMFLAIILSAQRFRMLFQVHVKPSMHEAVKMIFASATLNSFLPSKIGDLLKSFFVCQKIDMRISLAISTVVLEKICDLLALLVWCLLGLLILATEDKAHLPLLMVISCSILFGALMISSLSFANSFFIFMSMILPSKFTTNVSHLQKSWAEVHIYFWQSRRNVINILGLSLLIWLLHLVQIWILTYALHSPVPLVDSFRLVTLSILAGLIPFTFAGIGIRDAAVIILFQSFMSVETAAALGVLFTLRYLFPGLIGLPFLSEYLQSIHQKYTNR